MVWVVAKIPEQVHDHIFNQWVLGKFACYALPFGEYLALTTNSFCVLGLQMEKFIFQDDYTEKDKVKSKVGQRANAGGFS